MATAGHLLRMAEAEARTRGCSHVMLTTYSFQARGFYEKEGYRVVGEMAGYPPGATYYWMRKDLRESCMAGPELPLFLITGAPGAGKSATAAALMRRFPFGLHIPVDDLREWVVSGISQPVPEFTEETGRQFRLAHSHGVAGHGDFAILVVIWST